MPPMMVAAATTNGPVLIAHRSRSVIAFTILHGIKPCIQQDFLQFRSAGSKLFSKNLCQRVLADRLSGLRIDNQQTKLIPRHSRAS